jgi:hypothetical protein
VGGGSAGVGEDMAGAAADAVVGWDEGAAAVAPTTFRTAAVEKSTSQVSTAHCTLPSCKPSCRLVCVHFPVCSNALPRLRVVQG